MKRYLIVFVSFLCIATAFGQVTNRKINWVADSASEYARPLAHFPGAWTSENGLPVYQEVIELENSNKRINLTNFVFEDLSSPSNKTYAGIQEELTINPRYIRSKEKFQVLLDFVPIIRKDQKLKKLVSFDVEITSTALKSAGYSLKQDWANSSVLANGRWVKLKTSSQGVHKITYNQLQSWGFPNPSAVRLYGNGGYMLPKMNDEFYYDDLQQNAVLHAQDGQGNNCIFFYATGTVKWHLNASTGQFLQQLNDYSDFAYYFLTDQGNEKLVSSQPCFVTLTKEGSVSRSSTQGILPNVRMTNTRYLTVDMTLVGSAPEETAPPNHTVSTFTERVFHELELENLIKSGRRWFSEKFLNAQSKTLTLPIKNRAAGQAINVFLEAAAHSSNSSSMKVTINSSNVDALAFSAVNTSNPITLFADLDNKSYELTSSSDELNITLKYLAANSSALAWLDFVTVNYMRNLIVDDQLDFRDLSGVGEGNITEFNLSVSGSNLQVWDVTDYTTPLAIPFSNNGNTASFKLATDELRELVAFYTNANLPVPELVGDVSNQNLHQLSGVEMVIISHPDFLNQANELAQFHQQNDPLAIEVVTPDKIYNEFSGGAPDVAGIRNFLKMLYDKEGSILKYVLLFGDGSYDNKNNSGEANNFILTYQSSNSLLPTSSFVTDDFFVLLDDGEGEYTGMIDLGIGRIPAKTTTEAKIIIDKIKNYASPNSLGAWRNVICFIGDDGDVNTHMRQADGLAQIVNQTNPAFYTDKIYFDAYEQKSTSGGERYPGVNDALNQRVKDGALILNYTGHANETVLADEKVLDINGINNWSNYDKLPIFVTATCEISRFDTEENSGGEHILFNPNGGGIGLFSTTRLVYSTPNYIINREFYKHVFSQDEAGNNLRMGEVLKRSKNGIGPGINKRNFTLLADPALRLAFPQYKIETETINGKPAGESADTIGSLSVVTIAGKITDPSGDVLSDFTGDLIPVVYDKKYTVETLGNGGEKPFQFEMQNNVIYKGVTTVSNGRFEFSFIVPKDISYAAGSGKIMYYANNGEIDAHGSYENFLIGGSGDGSIVDHDGPDVQLYLNDTGFKSGDQVGKHAILLANIEDEHGINTVGVGIGHDITAVLDDDYSNIMVLNDYFLSEKDNYKKGQVIFPLKDLSVGEHSLKLKVWDVLNNSTEVEIDFTVDEKLEITEISCYPNPATDYSNIVFTHNRPDESFDTKLEVYDLAGSLVDVLNKRIGSDDPQSLPFMWQISDSQMLIRNGAYLYRVIIVADDGYSTSKTGKIIISRY